MVDKARCQFSNAISSWEWQRQDDKIPSAWQLPRIISTLFGNTGSHWQQSCIVGGSFAKWSMEHCTTIPFIFQPYLNLVVHPLFWALCNDRPRYSTFLRVFTSRWADVLKFRSRTMYLGTWLDMLSWRDLCRVVVMKKLLCGFFFWEGLGSKHPGSVNVQYVKDWLPKSTIEPSGWMWNWLQSKHTGNIYMINI